jgi:hypothetical protein
VTRAAVALLALTACQPRAVEATRNGALRIVIAGRASPGLDGVWDFGTVPLGETARVSVEASNVGTDALDLLSVSLVAADTGAFFVRATPGHLEPGATSASTVTFAPVRAVAQSARLIFQHDADSPTPAVQLQGSGAP